MTFYEVLEQALALLQRHQRVSYRALKLQFHLLSDKSLEALKDELIYQRVARDEDGKGLVWTGERLPALELAASVTTQRATSDAAAVVPPGEHVQPSSLPPTIVPSDRQGAEPEPTHPTPEAERRQLTVMFCDLADSTTLSQQLDPEDLREVIRAYQQTSAEVVNQYDGHIAQHLGDGLLIYFGWPVAHEDDAQRALHSGLGIVEAVTTMLNPRLEAEKSVQLTIRIGVHTGPVVVGEMGGWSRHENLATGETVNIASRLEGLAAPNTMVISPMTARLVRGLFVLEDLGLHTLKGVAEPMPVFRVCGLLDTDEDETNAAGVPFLVGRDEEMGLLLRRWEQSKERLGQVVLLSGEAGIGKSSLVTMVRQHVVEAGYTCITLRCASYHTHSALYPVIEHVQRVLHVQPGDTPATRLDKLERVLGGYGRPLDEVVPLYAALLSVPVPEGRYPALHVSPQRQRQQTLDTLVAWLMEEAERHPTLAIWEDLHWADPSTLEMLGLVLEQTPMVPMLHVLTFRPGFAPPWPTRSHMTPITLNRLERPQVEALITHLAGGKTLPAEVVEYIVVKTDGVPLYVEELTKMLLESDLLRAEADAYALTGSLGTMAIPDTLQDSLMARLDQMRTAKEVAQLGAVLGREFPYTMLQAISWQDEATLQTSLARLVEAELLYQRGRPPHARYLFKHALIQDAAYASLLRSTRQQVHQRIAQVLEERFPDTVETQPELLAHHYTESGQYARALDYRQQAGQRARTRSAHVEAVAHLSAGLDVLSRLPNTPTRRHQELALYLPLSASLLVTRGNGSADVEQAYLRARELCEQLGETTQLARVLFAMCGFYTNRAEFDRAQEMATQLLDLAQRVDDSVSRLVGHHALGITLFFKGEFATAHAHLERAMALDTSQRAQSISPAVALVARTATYFYAALVHWMLGYPEQARQRGCEALTLARQHDNPFNLAAAHDFVARVHQLRREPEIVHALLEASLALSIEHSFPHWTATGTVKRGWALAVQGEPEAGIAQIRHGMAIWRRVGSEGGRPWMLGLLAEAYGRAAQNTEGFEAIAEALALTKQTGEGVWTAELYRLKGDMLLAQDNTRHQQEEAEGCLQQALAIARQQQARSWELRAATSLARLWQSQDKRQAAYDLLAPVYDWFTEGFDTADLKEAKALLDTLRG